MRFLFALGALAAALAFAVTLAVAARGAVSPSRGAAVAEYCPPGEFDARQAAVDQATMRLAKARPDVAKLRAKQLKARATVKNAKAQAKLIKAQNKTYANRIRNLRVFEDQLTQAQAQLGRCD